MSWLTKLGESAFPAAKRLLGRRPPPLPNTPPPPLINPDGSPLTRLINPEVSRRQFLQGTGTVANQVLNPLNAPSAVRSMAEILSAPSSTTRPLTLLSRNDSELSRILNNTTARSLADDKMFNSNSIEDYLDLVDESLGMLPDITLKPFSSTDLGLADNMARKIADDLESGYALYPSHYEIARDAARVADDPQELRAFLNILERDRKDLLKTADPDRLGDLKHRIFQDSSVRPRTPEPEHPTGWLGSKRSSSGGLAPGIRTTAKDLMKLSDSDLRYNQSELRNALSQGFYKTAEIRPFAKRFDNLFPKTLSKDTRKRLDIVPYQASDIRSRYSVPFKSIEESTSTSERVKEMARIRKEDGRRLTPFTGNLSWKKIFTDPVYVKRIAKAAKTDLSNVENSIVAKIKSIPMQESARSRINETLNDFLGLTTLNLTAKVTKATFNKLAQQLEKTTKAALPTVQDLIPLEYKPMIDDLIKVRKEAQKDLLEIRQQLPD